MRTFDKARKDLLPPMSPKDIERARVAELLGAMTEGRPFALPSSREFSIVEVAHILNVSRPFVIKEIEAGRLAHRIVGPHRRIACEDLIAYARKMRERQEAALERLAENARDLGLEY